MRSAFINLAARSISRTGIIDMPRPKSPSKTSVAPRTTGERWRVPAVCVGLAAITVAVFGQTLTHDFINYDDNVYVYENPIVSRGLTARGFAWAFDGAHAGNWHPLTWLDHMLDCQIYGLNPGGHHLTNLILQTVAVLALFLVLREMTGVLWRSAIVAAVFAIHPLRAESVAWVAERKDLLSGLFFVLTIGAYAGYARHSRSWLRYGLVVLLFVIGLMCKPMLVTLPLILFLLDFWPLRRVETAKRLIIEKLPFLALSAASCVVTLIAQRQGIHDAGSFSFLARLANAAVTAAIYLRQMIWPTGLAVFYPYPHNGLPTWEIALAALVLAGISALAWNERRRQPWLLVGWLWYLIMLLPVIGLVQVGDQAHADRYTYLPGIGIAIGAIWLVGNWKLQPAVAKGLTAAVLIMLIICGRKQTSYWKNNETLWTHALECTTDNDVAHLNLGEDLSKRGMVDKALAQYQQTLEINPDSDEAHFNLGNAYRNKNDLNESMAQYQTALQLNPKHARAHVNLGIALAQMGRIDDAIAEYQKALEIDPDFEDGHYNLAVALGRTGKLDEAVGQYKRALEINPNHDQACFNLGNIFMEEEKWGDAITEFDQTLKLNPAKAEAENNLAWILATCPDAALRNGNKAVELASRANQMTDGQNPIVLHTLAAALAEAGRFPDAAQTADRALELAGSNSGLKGQLEQELELYRVNKPFHLSVQTH
jgi:tetratricopeptide (TPR) repeat protein